MELKKYDGERVRIETDRGEGFEGPCRYNGEDYGEYESGRREESLEILNVLFFKSEIVRIERLKSGPCGHYSAPFGRIESLILEDRDADLEDVFSEGEEQILRLTACAEDRLNTLGAASIPPPGEWERCLESFSDGIGEELKKRILALTKKQRALSP